MRLLARLAALTGLAGLLAACDDGTVITRVMGTITNPRSHVVPMASGGLPTEVHNAPFAGMGPGEVVSRLRMPGDWPADIRFRLADTPGRGARLVLVFNPADPPNGFAACALTQSPRAAAPRETGFAVTASFCAGDRVIVTGHMEARKTRADDPAEFGRVMTALFQAMFADDR
ncbi:MAG: hypothetical protein ACK4WC_02550 [Rubrimonas sp.]